jgi:multiple sugar transport system substrate-binding protein
LRRESEFRYLKLAHILREQIMNGYIKPGEFLMSENELCKFYGLSRTSVRKSLDELVKEGLIIKKAGQGTMVAPDLKIPDEQRKVLRIITPTPSYFAEYGLPLIIDFFKAQFPNIDVKTLNLPTGNYWDAVRACNEMGLHADLVLASDRQFAEMDDMEWFDNLELPAEAQGSNIYEKILRPFQHAGVIKAAPVTFSTVYLAYNPNLFQKYGVPEPGANWCLDQFIEAATQLTRDTNGDGIIDLYGLGLSYSSHRWPVFGLCYGVDFEAPLRNRERTLKALNSIHDLLYRSRVATLYKTSRHEINSDAFVREKVAMVLTTTLEMAGWKNDMNFEAKAISLPFGDVRSTLLVANVLLLPSTSNHPEVAKAFIDIALQSKVQRSLAETCQFLSIYKGVNEMVWSKPFLNSLNVSDSGIEDSRFLQEIFSDFSVLDELESEMELFWAGLESADAFAETWSQILAQESRA